MAHIIIGPKNASLDGGKQFIVNGVDYSDDVYADPKVVKVGEGETAEWGVQVTFVLNRLDVEYVSDHIRDAREATA